MNGWSYLTNGRSWLPLLCTTSRSIIIYHQSIIIYLTRYVNLSFIHTLCMVDHTWPIHAFFQYSCYLFSIRYGQWTVDRNLPCPQRWTFFTKKLKHIQYVAQAYVRQASQDFRFLLTSIYLRFPFEIGEKVPIFVEKLKKMKPPKMTFRSQIEPSIKSYECFMFFQNFRLEITLDWWILERQVRRLCHKAPKKHHTLPADVLPNASEALVGRYLKNIFSTLSDKELFKLEE